MSNTNKGVLSLFKKASSREANEGTLHVRRSRSSDVDTLSYLKPHKDISDRLNDLESERKEKERKRKELEKKARHEERQKHRKESPRCKLQKKETSEEKKLGQSQSGENLMYTGKPRGTPETDDDFKRNIENLERNVENLDLRSKMMATLWINRLKAPTHYEDEIRARNIITAHLLKCRNENIFQKEPFSLPPTSDTLANIRQKMFLTRDTPCHDMTLSKRMETKSYLNKLFHSSYDNGKFLSQLPVPREGAFFILHMRPNVGGSR